MELFNYLNIKLFKYVTGSRSKFKIESIRVKRE